MPGKLQPGIYVRPSKFTFMFSRKPHWRSQFNTSGASTPPDCGQAWPKGIADVPEFQPNPHIPIAEEHGGWLSQARSRIGKCITFGLPEERLPLAGQVVKTLADWRWLSFAKYGFSVAYDKPFSLSVRAKHPLIDKPLDSMITKGRFEPEFFMRLFNHSRCIWLRASKAQVPWKDVKLKKMWASMGLHNSPYYLETNEINFSILDHQRGPTGNLTVFHRLRPGFVKPDGTMHNSFDIDSQVVSVRQERVVAKAMANLSIVVRKDQEELADFDSYMAGQLLGLMVEQDDQRRRAEKTHAWIEHQLKVLENNSWNKEGTVEDLGTAAKA